MADPSRFHKLVSETKSHVKEVSAAEANERRSQGTVLIDVREADEFANGHAQGAVHLSRGVLEMRIESAVPDVNTPIVCYCGGGMRSVLAAENLQKMGYTNVASMAGGMRAWREEGLPTE